MNPTPPADPAREPPAGFVPIRRPTPFRELIGPIYFRKDASGISIGVIVEHKHKNMAGLLHGGMVASLADVALGIAISESEDPPVPVATISLSIDYADTAAEGDWVEARCDVQRIGRSIAFANCFIWCGDRRIARASGTFAIRRGGRPKE